ncbi:hypothetical protein Bca4012_029058 [Brassica carinata]
MGLLKPFKNPFLYWIIYRFCFWMKSLLILLTFLRKECQERGATIIYATHIFDGLEDWPTHILRVGGGKKETRRGRQGKKGKPMGLPELETRAEESRVTGDPARMLNNGWAAGRLRSTIAGGEDHFVLSPNRVLR